MRPFVFVLVLGLAAWLASSPVVAFAQTQRPTSRTAEDLARARALDQQGAKAYADGRFNDAIRYFEEAHRLGGPPFELWNIAKCYVRLDQPEQAAEVLERYLSTPTLSPEDRDEATQQLQALRRRPSTVTLTSSPSGAEVTVDGKPAEGGRTPTSFIVQPGPHTIALSLPPFPTHTQPLEARYGRAIILDVRLDQESKLPRIEPSSPTREVQRVALRADLGVMLPRYGSLGGSAMPTAIASGTYRFADAGATSFGAGAIIALTGDSWRNTIGGTNRVQPCGTLKDATSATALSFFAVGTAGWAIAPRLRAEAVAGAGVAAYFAGDLGGDVFVSMCNASPGARPALLMGARIDYALTPLVRLSALPVLLQLQPSFEGTRSTPVDTSGVWLRVTFAIGAGVDL